MIVPPKPTSRKSTPFYWWRRFPVQKYNSRQSLVDRIKAGEFDPSPYIEQSLWEIEWMKQEMEEETSNYINHNSAAFYDEVAGPIKTRYMKRFKKLTEDSWADEDKRLSSLIKALRVEFSLPEIFVQDFLSDFDGSVLEAYNSLRIFCEKHNSVIMRRVYLKNMFNNPW
jgi:hypothetical protein